MAGRNIEDKIRCSFCGKSQEQVRKMIAGPNGAFICDECVEVCTEIIEEEFEEEENVQPEGMAEEIHLYKPEELKAFLDEYVIGQDEAKKVLSAGTIVIDITVGDGPCSATGYGCDLTYDYVRINGDYRT